MLSSRNAAAAVGARKSTPIQIPRKTKPAERKSFSSLRDSFEELSTSFSSSPQTSAFLQRLLPSRPAFRRSSLPLEEESTAEMLALETKLFPNTNLVRELVNELLLQHNGDVAIRVRFVGYALQVEREEDSTKQKQMCQGILEMFLQDNSPCHIDSISSHHRRLQLNEILTIKRSLVRELAENDFVKAFMLRHAAAEEEELAV